MKKLSKLADWVLPCILFEMAFMYQFAFENDPWTWMAIYCFVLFIISSGYVLLKQLESEHDKSSKASAVITMFIVFLVLFLIPVVIKFAYLHSSSNVIKDWDSASKALAM